jgi:CheY-like chemotaxis protein
MHHDDHQEPSGGDAALAVSLARVVTALLATDDPRRALRRVLALLSSAVGERPCALYRPASGGGFALAAGTGELPPAVSGDLGALGTLVPVPGEDMDALVVAGPALAAAERSVVEAAATAIGAALARVAAEQMLREGQAMEAVGRLTVRVADDLTRLTREVMGDAEAIARAGATGSEGALPALAPPADRSRARPAVDVIRRHARQAAALAEQLRTVAGGAQAGAGATDLARAAELTCGLVDGLVGDGVALEVRGADVPRLVTIPRPVAEQVILRLVALLLAGASSRPSVVVMELDDVAVPAGADLPAGRYVQIRAWVDADASLPGAADAAADDPATRGRSTGDGGRSSGRGWDAERCRVGLLRLLQPRGGRIQVEQGADGPTGAVVHLPCGQADEQARVDGGTGVPAAVPQVLLAEDQATVRSLLRGILTQRGYRVLEAEDGMEALHLLGRAGRIDLLVTDLVMPNLGGRQLAEHARAMYPDLPAVFLTGYPEAAASAPAMPRSVVLHKPFGRDDFVRRVEEMLREDAPAPPAGA